ncbi:hypothetical protein AgCh_016135 [Apium graveolens]
MKTSKEEKHRVLNEKLKELEQHHYWNYYSSKLCALCLINRSPRKLMSSLQTKHSRSLSPDEENSLSSKECSSVCSDCFENEEEEEEVRSVVLSSASVHSDTCYNENNDDGINKIYEEEKELEIKKGPGEMINGTGTNVKNAEKIRNLGWEFSISIVVAVLIIGLVSAVMFSVNAIWNVDQDLDQLFLPPT